MNVHGALNHCVRCCGVHDIEDRMNYLIALDTQKRCAKDFFSFGIRRTFGPGTFKTDGLLSFWPCLIVGYKV